ncbi:hypothetical protein Pflav_044490 [Phytohabitans flavus]|uniref:MacB-like periplasmic core domain-containing protein n=1 Tax=Phytohabitans flavus TaxID=1076124 RepID=A0A6F8XW61_9ACTN|nr:hypothetical protein Pflav_044490 [Phytohabitans flavus]
MNPYSKLRAADLLPVATVGLRNRPARAALSVLGVAIGIAAVVAVLGITRSSQADVLARIDRLGTNLLTVVNGRAIGGQEAQLPQTAPASIARTEAVLATAPTAELDRAAVYRSDRMPAYSGAASPCAPATSGYCPHWTPRWRTARSSTRPPHAIRRPCSGTRRRARSASARSPASRGSGWAAGGTR